MAVLRERRLRAAEGAARLVQQHVLEDGLRPDELLVGVQRGGQRGHLTI